MEVVVKETYDEVCKLAAEMIARAIEKKSDAVLGLATGSTPIGVYKNLIQMYREKRLDFSRIRTFNLDEYLGLAPNHNQSYHYFMQENLFKHINIKPENVHIPDGNTNDITGFCKWYESEIKKVGGIDIQLLGLGANGHIGFNEPGSSLTSKTRVKKLTKKTITDNSRFFKSPQEVPQFAITMGIGTIMSAKEVVLIANGKNKADAIAKVVEGPITSMVPGSILQMHQKAFIFVDRLAGSKLKGDYESVSRSLEYNYK